MRIHRHAWRFVSGAHMAGRPRTNHSFLYRGTRIIHPSGRAWRWSHMAGWSRALVRLGTLAVLAGGVYGWFTHRDDTRDALIGAGCLLAALGGLGLYRVARRWRHTRTVVHPLAAALAPLLGVQPLAAQELISLPARYGKTVDGPVGHVELPAAFAASPDQRKAVDHLLSSRLPIEIETTWYTATAPMRVAVAASPRPPDMVPWSSMTEAMADCPKGKVVIGLDRRRNVYRGDFNSDDPHWGMSVASGRGKSSFLQAVAAQVLHQDPEATVTGIDPKMSSLDPLIGIPGVVVANDPRNIVGMWDTIEEYVLEMESRLDRLAQDPTLSFPVSLLIVDELNQFSAMTAATWRAMKEKGDPAIAPMWMRLASVFWMGRAVHCHVIMVGQRLDEKATGGIGLRDSLGFRGLAGFRPQNWLMLVGTTPIPRSQKPRGRWIYSDGQDETWIQNVYGTPDEIRAYALEGRRPDFAAAPVSPIAVPDTQLPAETVPEGTGTGTAAMAAQVTWVVGMQSAADHLGIKVEAFKKRRQRAGGSLPGEVRQGNQPAWSATDLDAWRASWPRVVSATERESETA
jgi:hypothetical protein